MFLVTYLLSILIGNSVGVYTIISSKSDNVTFNYMNEAIGESDLHECKYNEACNIIHKRFWKSILTERLCRCPEGKECPWQWDSSTNNSTMTLNNRSVLQFCTSVVEMDTCAHRQEAVTVYGEGDTTNTYMIPHNVTVNCMCPQSHYWKLQKYNYEEDGLVQVFRCVKKKRCETLDFCGHIRSDLYSTYYRCTCPQGHLCIYKNKTTENVQELLYSGPAYKAYCYRFT